MAGVDPVTAIANAVSELCIVLAGWLNPSMKMKRKIVKRLDKLEDCCNIAERIFLMIDVVVNDGRAFSAEEIKLIKKERKQFDKKD